MTEPKKLVYDKFLTYKNVIKKTNGQYHMYR